VSLESELASVVGADHLLVDPALTASYESDWTRRFSGLARCVARPGDTAEVSAVLAACRSHAVPVVVQGGNTGLVGGAVPAGGEVLLSTARLRGLGVVEPATGQVTVGAGVALAVLQSHVRPHGYEVGVDMGSRDSATVGGMVATNAGGERVLRYGSMRSQVAGLEAVLADGTVLDRLRGLPKDNTGYDLTGLLCGSEGTLAVVTRARLRLVPAQAARAVAVAGFADTSAAIRTLTGFRRSLASLEAAELFYADGLALVRAYAGLADPLPGGHAAYLLVECADASDPTDDLVAAVAETAGVADAVVVSDSRGRADLWRYREAHTEAISAAGVPVKLDVAVPLDELAAFVAELAPRVAGVCPGARTIVFGHLAEGNLHVNVLDADRYEDAVADTVLRLVGSYGGSISAEHGVGRAKVRWLGLSRSPEELAAMTAVKRALDPDWLLAPGVLLPAP
jgi:FAD/FMN-containing dehydrogenase